MPCSSVSCGIGTTGLTDPLMIVGRISIWISGSWLDDVPAETGNRGAVTVIKFVAGVTLSGSTVAHLSHLQLLSFPDAL